MHWNGVISLRPAPGTWQRILRASRAGPEAAYGCVDWYLYQDASAVERLEHRAASASAASSAAPAAVSGHPTRSAG